jgi:hypothetical protein
MNCREKEKVQWIETKAFPHRLRKHAGKYTQASLSQAM